MDKLPSDTTATNVAFLYIPTFVECEEEHIDIVVLTTSGELLEISDKNIISSCSLCNKVEGYAIIKIYYTYCPKTKYYIVLANRRLFAIKKHRKGQLECLKILDNISQFSIEDKDNLGAPQIIASYADEKHTPSVLKLNDFFIKPDITKSVMASQAASKLYSHIHDIRLQIKTVEQLLIEKKSLISRITTDHMFIKNEDMPLDHCEKLVTVFGEKSANCLKPRNFPFSIGNLWIRVCFDCWVVGLYISNLKDLKVSCLELYVMDPDIRIEKTQFYTNEEKVEPFSLLTDFKKLDFIPCFGHGYVIGIIKEPYFKQSSIQITCNLGFSFENNKSEQVHLGTIEVSHVDILSSSCSSFSLNQEVPDLLSIFATSSKHGIYSKNFSEESKCDLNTLLSTLKFNKINEKYYLADHKRRVCFGGVLLQITYEQQLCTINFYTRNIQDLYLYIQPFKYLPADFCVVKKDGINLSTTSSSLFNEIKFFNSIVKSKLSSEKGANEQSLEKVAIPLEVTELNELLKLEEITEHNFLLKSSRKE